MLILFALLGLFVRYSSAGCKAWGTAGLIYPLEYCFVYSKNATETVAYKWQCHGSGRATEVQKFKYSDELCSTGETQLDRVGYCDIDGYGLQCWCYEPVCSEANIVIHRTSSPCSDKTNWIHSDMTVVNKCFGYPHWPSHKSGKDGCEADAECNIIVSADSYYDDNCTTKLTDNSPTDTPTVAITPAPVSTCTYPWGSGYLHCSGPDECFNRTITSTNEGEEGTVTVSSAFLNGDEKDNSLSGTAVFGICMIILIVIGILIVSVYCFIKKKNSKIEVGFDNKYAGDDDNNNKEEEDVNTNYKEDEPQIEVDTQLTTVP